MAHVKSQGSTTNGRDSNPKYLGLKASDGEYVKAGSIIVRQRGSLFYPSTGTLMGKDFTIFAVKDGVVKFGYTKGGRKVIKVV